MDGPQILALTGPPCAAATIVASRWIGYLKAKVTSGHPQPAGEPHSVPAGEPVIAPAMTGADFARAFGLSERTGRRAVAFARASQNGDPRD